MLLLDLLAYALTPSSQMARSLGLLKSSLQVEARHRRCREAWEPHLQTTRRVILEAAERCPDRRTAVLFGAGLLHDIPLAELAGMFTRVVLVDVVFPWKSRWTLRRFGNVERCVHDVTETFAALDSALRDPRTPLPVSAPRRFADDTTIDLAVSVNILSQLPIATHARALHAGRDESALEEYSRHLQQAHLDFLQRLPGRAVLITDTMAEMRDARGAVMESWDNLHGIALPEPDEAWEWRIAPAPEVDRRLDRVLRVAAYLNWKRAAT